MHVQPPQIAKRKENSLSKWRDRGSESSQLRTSFSEELLTWSVKVFPPKWIYLSKKKINAHPEVEKDRQIEVEKDAMMNTQEDQTKNRDLWQFEFQQKVSSSHLIDAHHLSQLSKNGFL